MKIQSIVLAIALASPASAALAQQSYWGPPRPFYADPYARPAVPIARQACVRWCPSDLNPCDPPEFKISDGRCNGDRGDRR